MSSVGPGDKVLCIRGGPHAGTSLAVLYPQTGVIYTVRELVPTDFIANCTHEFLLLEIKNEPILCAFKLGRFEPTWNPDRFTPITPEEEHKASMDLLRRLADSPKELIDA